MSDRSGNSRPRSPRFLADENLEAAIVDGVRRKRPGVVFSTARDAGTVGQSDQDVLLRAKELDVIPVSHDRKTMYSQFAEFLGRINANEESPGIFLVTADRYSIGQIVQFILDVYDFTSHDEWRNRITDLPV